MTLPSLELPSPLHRLDVLSELWNVDLWVKRDDLIPIFLGGNKVRKVHRLLQDALSSDRAPHVLITNGGVQSNHARVVALMGARLGITTYLVLHGEKPSGTDLSGNAFFQHAAGANICYVDSEAISDTIKRLEGRERGAGRSVLIIPGGGHHASGAAAYSDAIRELPFAPEMIVHPSGTGGTQAGLIAGCSRAGMDVRVIGVSVARTEERGVAAIRTLLSVDTPGDAIIFNDAYRFGGYEQSSRELDMFIADIARLEGLPLDPTYTGKAMFALRDLILKREIEPGAKIVFWHTGGLLNLVTQKRSNSVRSCASDPR